VQAGQLASAIVLFAVSTTVLAPIRDLTTIGGKRDPLVGKIQNSYGIGKDEAEKQLGEWEARQGDADLQ
jgi:hypothetical protein